ncbi:MAG: FAD-binding protein [Candidatus Riflebacteria bacterium]|nr:FAD-binding protein [Candidatus Riflebacteria bacterium]
MSWSHYWFARARSAAARRRETHGLPEPPELQRILAAGESRLGVLASLWLMMFVLVGSPRQLAQIAWWHLTDRDTPGRRRRIAGLAEELREKLSSGSRVIVGYFERRIYSRDVARVPGWLEKFLHRTTPLCVVQPRTEADVRATLAFAVERRLPVYPRGVSSSPFGGAVPTTNGIVLDLSTMDGILEVDAGQRTVRLQPGVRWADLDAHLEAHGLVASTTPTSRFSTVGGWASTGGLGLNGFKYGHLSRAIAHLRVALPTGAVLPLDGTDDTIWHFLGTEGQLGVVTELTLRVIALPTAGSAHLFHFDDELGACRFIDELVSRGHEPAHVAFYDRARMLEENRVFSDRSGAARPIVEERDAVLVRFDDDTSERRFLADPLSAGRRGTRAAAAYLWSERFFPLKAQRLGPSLLASEVVLPHEAVPQFIDRGRHLARLFGSPLAIEVLVSRQSGTLKCVTIASFPCNAQHRWDYLLRLVLVQLLTYTAVALGGRPYGFGIWNSPFLTRGYPPLLRDDLIEQKLRHDPHLVLNPLKWFRLRARFSVRSTLFLGPVFVPALWLARLFSPVLGLLGRLLRPVEPHTWSVPPPEAEDGRRLVGDAAVRCTFCGACISTCPAYRLTRDEMVTGRAKLRLGEALMEGDEVTPDEASSPFRCLQCGLCEEVCQTRLPLRSCYDVLERWLEKRIGRPTERIDRFVELVDSSRDTVLATCGLLLPPVVPGASPPVTTPGGPKP